MDSSAVLALFSLHIEQYEARLLLGSPVTSTDAGRGAARSVSDEYADGCWLNEPSGVEYDSTGFVLGVHTSCVCGFCVDAALPVETPPAQIDAVDLHWTSGPWVRLDGATDVTIEHRVMTPRGAVPASELVPGDEVFASDGAVRA